MLAALALLLAVISSPIRPTGASHTAHPTDIFFRSSAIPKIEHSGHLSRSARPSLREADSPQSAIEDGLDADIEDELTVTSPVASVSFQGLASPCPERYSELVSLAVVLAARPLRC
jgi:hypothetical protein